MSKKKLMALAPDSLEFLEELLQIALSSSHKMDLAVAEGLKRMIALKELENARRDLDPAYLAQRGVENDIQTE